MSRFAPVRSKSMEALAHALRNGQSNGQRNQAMLDKAMIAIPQAALMAGQGIYRGTESYAAQQKADADAEAARLQTAPGDYKPYDDGSAEPPAWLKGGKPGPLVLPEEHQDPVDLSMASDQAALNMQSNAAAAGANIGGYRTPKGLDDADGESDMRAADINTSKNMMRMGGMMSSLPRR